MPEFAPSRRAEQLADWARNFAEVGDPRFSMQRLAAAFDLPIFTVAKMKKAGSLQLINHRIVILVREASAPRRRFTAAHELGHYLLAAKEGIPIRHQLVDPVVERYCDEFASHLLMPRRWLREQAGLSGRGLAGAFAIAAKADSSLPAVVVALNQRAGWRRRLVRWRSTEDGFELIAINGPRSDVLASTPDAERALSTAERTPSERTITITTRFGSARFNVEVARRGRWFYGLIADDPGDLLWDQIHPELDRHPTKRRLESGMR